MLYNNAKYDVFVFVIFQVNLKGRSDKSNDLYNQLCLILILEGTTTMWHQA